MSLTGQVRLGTMQIDSVKDSGMSVKPLSWAAVLFLLFASAQAQEFSFFKSPQIPMRITASQEWIYATRQYISQNAPVVQGGDNALLAFDDLAEKYNSGYRLSLGLENDCQRIEILFTDFPGWGTQHSGSLTTGLSFDNAVGGAWPAGSSFLDGNTLFPALQAAATSATATDENDGLGPDTANGGDIVPTYRQYYRTELQVNWKARSVFANIQPGIGYRNVQLDEQAGATIAGTFRAADVAAPDGGISHASLIAAGLGNGGTANGFEDEVGNGGLPDTLTMNQTMWTSNDLNGFQAVLDFSLLETERFHLTMTTRGGAYHNYARGRITETYTGVGDDTSTYHRDLSDTGHNVVFIGGVGVQTSWCLNNYLRVIAGYQGTFISGVALAPEQSAGIVGTGYTVQTNGNLAVHGGTLSLEISY